jgi:hypothetical protein
VPLTRLEEIRQRVSAAAEGPYCVWAHPTFGLLIRKNVTATDAEATPAEGELLDNAPTDLAYLLAVIDQADEDRRILYWERGQYRDRAELLQAWLDDAQAQRQAVIDYLQGPPRRPAREVYVEILKLLGASDGHPR